MMKTVTLMTVAVVSVSCLSKVIGLFALHVVVS